MAWNEMIEGAEKITGIQMLGEFVQDPFAAARNAITFNLDGVSTSAAPAPKPTGRSIE